MKNGLDTANVERNIRLLMYRNDLSTSSFAKEIGVKFKCISSIMDGVNKPGIDTIIKIANTFGVTVDWLLSKNVGEV